MTLDQQLVVGVTPDGKAYTYWIEDVKSGYMNPPVSNLANTNYTVAATLGTAIVAELPALNT